jgi:hypothetical protein
VTIRSRVTATSWTCPPIPYSPSSDMPRKNAITWLRPQLPPDIAPAAQKFTAISCTAPRLETRRGTATSPPQMGGCGISLWDYNLLMFRVSKTARPSDT